ncbi:hypothetical protein A3I27_04680 [Candidatus Giovannonibacteria bacterium RIFCSPLOWO2_02_FULL_43_11b]|uniref:AMP-dependent synthetase/ligase domain-containing protein n=1 Tax=Candidatus Giovannonibacteria bacterium RIFCSPHIGHO2_12_FULL_43_15 TaxID=1798341 RepID=A0A1F5WRM0_9BACT|nr:MAG: hypothetical protein A2739_02420 [Candidatus Giovannonibacteria bacterium RIFCSPHIGHO2_01_FULL_43_100]OGF67261.1 MAG: hypothetical protein A3B97_00415 [Candidatus Giovannonibacteria bacterium RIFCSPHIGHO2_02_FULL_43_32]OGF78254.1 MAG: hypothetical protein A3F23_02375 [Candidatus Giovannonibacteria bacterium RIFCSPHIGHO2_12_FULL_43_15]OGF78759.1 MAG: hypothetical protein A3A15_00865 [Candidatus Giovannonibacteria bacterium RIFCSPLOWO2_01_FULL_43_60]OGF90321.1 MAG: hypothetical protein A3
MNEIYTDEERQSALRFFNDFLKSVAGDENSYYRDKYKQAGFDWKLSIENFIDIEKIPVLTNDNIDMAIRMHYESIHGPGSWKDNFSGLLTIEERYGFLNFAKVSDEYGSASQKTLEILSERNISGAITLTPSSFTNRLARVCRKLKLLHIIGDPHAMKYTAVLADYLKIDSLIASYQNALNLGKEMDITGAGEYIKFIFVPTGHLSFFRLQNLSNFYPHAVVENAYRIIGGNIVGYRCRKAPYEDPNLFHLYDDMFVELLREGGAIRKPGNIIVSSIKKHGFLPLVRYKTSDLGIWEDEICACGKKFLRVVGSVDKEFHFEGIKLDIAQLKNVLFSIHHVDFQFQIHVTELFSQKNKATLRISLEYLDDKANSKSFIDPDHIANRWIIKRNFPLKHFIDEGLIQFDVKKVQAFEAHGDIFVWF